MNRVPHCKFTPTCSIYSIDALKEYGFLKWIFFSIKRIIRCHPWSHGGYDPVKKEKNLQKNNLKNKEVS